MPVYTTAPSGKPTWSDSFVLHERARQYVWQGVGSLSIKAFFSGRAHYDVGHGAYAVDGERYLLLNEGQPYTISIDADQPVESFCVFFAPGLAEQVYHSLTADQDTLLANPGPSPSARVAFYERTYPHDEYVAPMLLRLRRDLALAPRDANWLDERLHTLMGRLLAARLAAQAEAQTLPAARAATREETYRRLHQARDYANALFDTPISLGDLARVANLSPNHLLRTFKEVFGQTPHQYLTELRLERAQRLLLSTERSVTDICFAVGFQSVGSFSWLFRRRFGVSPASYRRACQTSGVPFVV